jgi:Crinkler effector protein N-terminal domain
MSDSPFPVDIAKNKTVSDLKKEIKKKGALAGVDADSRPLEGGR